MADTLQWFRLWVSALTDPDLDNLSVADFGRWCKLGAYIKQQGDAGEVVLHPPSRSLCGMFQVPDFDALIGAIRALPNVITERKTDTRGEEGKINTSGVTVGGVTFSVRLRNWSKYQEDTAWVRMRRKREKDTNLVTLKRRGEEKRREERRREENKPQLPCRAQRDVAAVFSFWQWWMERPRAKLTPDRRQKINTRLREGYGFDTIARACIGLSKSPFHRGGNDNGKVYDDITLICRNGSKLEGFADLASEQDAREEIDNWRREAGQDVAVPPSGKA